jgi:hypothetical protein
MLECLSSTRFIYSQQQHNADPGVPSDSGSPEQIDHWMKGWMTRGYQGPLILSRFVDPIYFLYSPIKWLPPKTIHDPQLSAFTVPKGFVTDLASIPRIFWSALRPDGNYAYSAILHDYLYWTQSRPREAADTILRESMTDFHVSPATIATIYEAVRLGGQKSWDQNQRLKSQGENRMLTVFPDDPTLSWATWKADKSHFVRPT